MQAWVPISNPVVDKFIYEAIYEKFFERFTKKYTEKDGKFAQRTALLREFNDIELLKDLDVKDQFILGKSTNSQYVDAINELEKIQYCKTPRDKLDCLVMAHSSMRGAVVKYTKAKVDIESMDDELPITIFIVSRVKNLQFFSHLQYISSYLNCKEESDHQQKMVENLIVGVEYICKEWATDKIKHLSPEGLAAQALHQDKIALDKVSNNEMPSSSPRGMLSGIEEPSMIGSFTSLADK